MPEQETLTTQIRTEDKGETLAKNLETEAVVYNRAGLEMDNNDKQQFLETGLDKEAVREITVAPENEHISEQEQKEAVRDVVYEQFDGQSVDYCYSIHANPKQTTGSMNVDPTEGTEIEPAGVGVEPADVGVDSKTYAKITMHGEKVDVNEPGVDPEKLDEHFQRQFRNAQRDPYLEPRQAMSEERKQEMGHKPVRTRRWWFVGLGVTLQSPFTPIFDLFQATLFAATILMTVYLLGRRFAPERVPHMHLRERVYPRLRPPRRIRLVLPWTDSWRFMDTFLGLLIVVFWLAIGSTIMPLLLLLWVIGFNVTSMISRFKHNSTWVSAVDNDKWPLEYHIIDSSPEFDESLLTDIVTLDPEGSIGVMGAARSGKTQTMYVIAYQMIETSKRLPDDLKSTFIAYDRKDDWQEFLPENNTIRLAGEDGTHLWNLFREVEKERDFDVMGRLLFPQSHESGGNDFFPRASRQLFAAACKYLKREFEKQDHGLPTNADLVRFFRRDRQEMYQALGEYDDLTAARTALDPEAEGQAAGVYASVQQEVQDSFVADFAQSPQEADKPSFSFREYTETPDDQYVLLNHQQRLGDAVDRIFRYFIDRSVRLGLDSEEQMSYFILDEFARVPHLRNMGELVSVGPGKNVKSMVALQSKTQLDQNYGEDQANSILAGLLTQIILRLNDQVSVDHARSVTGNRHISNEEPSYEEKFNERVRKTINPFAKENNDVERMKTAQSDFAGGEFLSFNDGESVIVRKDGWVRGYMPMLEDQVHKIDAAHGWNIRTDIDKQEIEQAESHKQITPTSESDD